MRPAHLAWAYAITLCKFGAYAPTKPCAYVFMENVPKFGHAAEQPDFGITVPSPKSLTMQVVLGVSCSTFEYFVVQYSC